MFCGVMWFNYLITRVLSLVTQRFAASLEFLVIRHFTALLEILATHCFGALLEILATPRFTVSLEILNPRHQSRCRSLACCHAFLQSHVRLCGLP